MSHLFLTLCVALGLCIGMLALLELGRRIGQRRLDQDPEAARAGIGTVDGAVFALLGLLLAFSFSGAASRFDLRKDLIIDEANDIGTAWLRVDLLPLDIQSRVRPLFRGYLDSRLLTYRKLPDMAAVKAEYLRSQKLQSELWALAVAGCETKRDPGTTTLVLSALNAMFDTGAKRMAAPYMHPPLIIFALLITLSLGCAFLAGHGMAGGKSRSLSHMIGFALAMAVSVYVILDLEYPRLGLIRVDTSDQILVDLRQSMN